LNIFIVKGFFIPIDRPDQIFTSSGWEYFVWFTIYFSIAISSLSNILFLASPFIIKKRSITEHYRLFIATLWIAVLSSLTSGLYVALGFHTFNAGYFVWVISFLLITIGFKKYTLKSHI